MRKTVDTPPAKPAAKKLGRLEAIAEATRARYTHQNSVTVLARQDLLMFEQGQLDVAIVNLTAALESKKTQRNDIGAKLAGLAEVLSCR